ncbi:DUF421 domain-containing protein [Oceanisphaera avium]|uniref:DUF421 domain-containing protein n=1 Tax=Oceanisphaera avium TaxID=1903694 RepID=A0A1Y0CX25_9GAMM|nr:YetF domain-containing protein [Oceanisphaera avium]ART79891.1 hypothetical protein CBP12_06765 [Oceanisphaera avium]
MNWLDIFFYDTTGAFLAEIAVRVVIMFTMIILFLRFTGKRGVRQLSIFELTIILSLGSIAGDPMFTKELPLIQAVWIMSLIISLYRLCTWLMMKCQVFEDFLEGKPLYIVEDGVLVLDKIKKGGMSQDEFFAEMRYQGIEHLGQVRVGLLETDGNFSVLLFEKNKVRYGLPIFPRYYQSVSQIETGRAYACMYCGQVATISSSKETCSRCNNNDMGWAQAINSTVIR